MNFNEILPYKILISLKDLENYGVIKVSMAKKLINKGELEAVKIGWKLFISRDEIYYPNMSRQLFIKSNSC